MVLNRACPDPAAQNQFDSIDLSDNAVVKLEGFPRMLRLKQLLLNNNRISRIAKKLEGERRRCMGQRRNDACAGPDPSADCACA